MQLKAILIKPIACQQLNCSVEYDHLALTTIAKYL